MATKASKFLATKRITTKMMYKEYIKKNPDSKIAKEKNYNLFKKIVGDCHKQIVEECIRGEAYNFGERVGTLEVTKYNKDFYLDKEGKPRGLKVDFGATRKNKAAGNTEVIYHTNMLVCKWTWRKSSDLIALAHKTMWQMAFTDGPNGISRKLHHHIEANPRCTLLYRTSEAAFITKMNNE